MSMERVTKPLASLRQLRSMHGFRAETLVLISPLSDSMMTRSRPPRKHYSSSVALGRNRAYAMVRVAFEAAQRLLVLATAQDYVHLGTRWLYYVGKDQSLRTRTDSKNLIEDYRDQIIQSWGYGTKTRKRSWRRR